MIFSNTDVLGRTCKYIVKLSRSSGFFLPQDPLRRPDHVLRDSNQDREAEVSEVALSEVAVEPQPVADILPWRGRGNVIAAAGSFLVGLLERA
jgi:hypothetical protein